MGNFWTGASMDALERAERGLYESMGLVVNKDLRIRNVAIHP